MNEVENMGEPKRVVASYDGMLTLYIGSSRRAKTWKAKQIGWSQLVQKLSVTKRTPEKQSEYLAMPKERQDEIKDVGGFVGGVLTGGRRSSRTVESRQLVALDADFAEKSMWDMVETGVAFGGNAICMYSTHKHTKEKPRLRLLIPLSRPVSPDEYQAIARKIAEDFGIDNFDDTTYQHDRLMYWPSTSIDGEYEFRWQDGPWVDADGVLAEYEDWRDQTKWPVSSRVGKLVQKSMKKQQDPTEKKGLIGTFCRAYSISEAIEKFLPDVYEACKDDRYTFKAGSSTGGAVVYEDKWLYSFHSTDPCSCQLVNAFDLVRIHKYGDLDEDRMTKDPTKLPSYERMMLDVRDDEQVKALQVQERMAEAREEFDDLGEEEADFSWAKNLKQDKNGKYLACRSNIRLILENDPHVKNTFGWDAFAQRIALLRKPSWRKAKEDEYWADADDAELRYYIETYYEIDSRQKMEDEVTSVAMRNSFHLVRDYLDGLKWDGVERVERVFVDYLGAEDSNYTRVVTRKMLIAAVGRVMKPGMKFDTMVVLQGRQGIGKSMLLKKLGKKWFSDSLDSMNGKEAYEQLRGYWIIEVGELAALRKNEVEATKKFITKQVDSYRVAYGHRTEEFPRQCIFVGTTNEAAFLKDRTGNRRFLPVPVGVTEPEMHPWDDGFDEVVDQIWAEAYHYWKEGEDVWIGSILEKEAEAVQKKHLEDDPLDGMIQEYLDTEVPKNWYKFSLQDRKDFLRGDLEVDMDEAFIRTRVCPLEVWCELLEGNMRNFNGVERKRVREILDELPGWHLYREGGRKLSFGKLYGLQRAYLRDGIEISHGGIPDLAKRAGKGS